MAVGCSLVATRGRPWWALEPAEVKQLADALDPPLSRIPLPERELGIVAELGALGFVCFAIAAPRMALDGQLREARKLGSAPASPPSRPIAVVRDEGINAAANAAVVAEAERIAAQWAQAPYADVSPLDALRGDRAAPPTDELMGAAIAGEAAGRGVTVGDTDPDLFVRVDSAARAAGVTPETIVRMRHELGADGALLDAYPGVPTDGQGRALGTGVDE